MYAFAVCTSMPAVETQIAGHGPHFPPCLTPTNSHERALPHSKMRQATGRLTLHRGRCSTCTPSISAGTQRQADDDLHEEHADYHHPRVAKRQLQVPIQLLLCT